MGIEKNFETIRGTIKVDPSWSGGDLRPQFFVFAREVFLKKVFLEGAETRIGRLPGNDVVLDSEGVSRYHCRVFRKGDRYFVEDLDSSNGIHLNGKRLPSREPHGLCHGDKIQLFDHTLFFLHQGTFVNRQGLSTITFDRRQVAKEVESLLKQFPDLRNVRTSSPLEGNH